MVEESGAIITAGCSNKLPTSAESSPVLETSEVNMRKCRVWTVDGPCAAAKLGENDGIAASSQRFWGSSFVQCSSFDLCAGAARAPRRHRGRWWSWRGASQDKERHRRHCLSLLPVATHSDGRSVTPTLTGYIVTVIKLCWHWIPLSSIGRSRRLPGSSYGCFHTVLLQPQTKPLQRNSSLVI